MTKRKTNIIQKKRKTKMANSKMEIAHTEKYNVHYYC